MKTSTEAKPGESATALIVVKVVHTIAWAFFAGCILAIPLASWQGHHAAAAWLIAIVRVEVAILVVNGWRCPLTSLAARYTKERHDNFDRRRSVEIVMAARTGPGHHRSHATVGALLP